MFVTRMTTLLYGASLLVCCQLFPMNPGDERLYGHYGMGLAKKDPSLALKNSLLSALLMSDMPKGGGSPSQRKKAVDSTFIRFGRSSMPNAKPFPNFSPNEDNTQDFDYYGDVTAQRKPFFDATTMDNLVMGKDEQQQQSLSSPQHQQQQQQFATIQNGCLVKNKNDLYQVLLGKSCIRPSPKIKRENVNDTFIRFGKRDVSSSLTSSDKDIKYGR